MAAASPYRIPGERPTWVEPPVIVKPVMMVPVEDDVDSAIAVEDDGISLAVYQASPEESLSYFPSPKDVPAAPKWTANELRWLAVAVAIGIGMYLCLYAASLSYR